MLPLRKQDSEARNDKARKQKARIPDRDEKMEFDLSEELPDKPGIHRIDKIKVRPSVAQGQLELDVSLEG